MAITKKDSDRALALGPRSRAAHPDPFRLTASLSRKSPRGIPLGSLPPFDECAGALEPGHIKMKRDMTLTSPATTTDAIAPAPVAASAGITFAQLNLIEPIQRAVSAENYT